MKTHREIEMNISKQQRDLWRREQAAEDALEAIDPDQDSDAKIVKVAHRVFVDKAVAAVPVV